jgi:AcrR family transcriptional regulator
MRSNGKKGRASPRTRLKAEARRELIVEGAFKAVAEHGFEGLRTRDIAAQVGINSATLHHHFPTKGDLIAAVASRLERRLQTEKSRGLNDPATLAALDSQIEDVVRYHREDPALLAVYREFVGRAARDAAVHALVMRLHAGWHASVVSALTRGREDGSVRWDIDVNATAGLILSVTWGLVSHIFASKGELEAAARQLRSWLMCRPQLKNRRVKTQADPHRAR